ncbi:MAG: 10 kDa chaperonin [Planctomycetia bacterium]|jgi:chaperonin GroES|nr:co-chaperone GroES [Planctomycetota bacterium]OQZ01252.1 MAG: co-chaperone GroES [Planctomycetes bacterium UTPLA1]
MARLNLKPLDDRIVVEQNVAEERTAGGILLPDNVKEKPTRGKVMATGPGKMLDSGNRAPICVRVGDEVIYGKYSGTEVEVTGKKYTVLRESDVLAVVEK